MSELRDDVVRVLADAYEAGKPGDVAAVEFQFSPGPTDDERAAARAEAQRRIRDEAPPARGRWWGVTAWYQRGIRRLVQWVNYKRPTPLTCRNVGHWWCPRGDLNSAAPGIIAEHLRSVAARRSVNPPDRERSPGIREHLRTRAAVSRAVSGGRRRLAFSRFLGLVLACLFVVSAGVTSQQTAELPAPATCPPGTVVQSAACVGGVR